MRSIVVSDLYGNGRPRTTEPVVKVWRVRGRGTDELAMRVKEDEVACRFNAFRDGFPPTRAVEFAVRVSWTPCNYGGRRAWLHCTEASCGRRGTRLYFTWPYLVCRRCADLRYRTQIMSADDRRRLRAQQIRRTLGPNRGETRLPRKPKRMHWRTYERLLDELYELERDEPVDEQMGLREALIRALERQAREKRGP